MAYRLAALYRFVRIDDLSSVQMWLDQLTSSLKIQGTLILASEGLNGTIAGSSSDITECVNVMKQDSRFKDMQVKFSDSDKHPFVRMNVKIKPEIVTMGVTDVSIDPSTVVGEYIDPNEWNKIINDEEVTVLDCRNDYEYDLGSFNRAINPNTKTFKEFPEFVEENLDPKIHKKVAMFCTGGIRCEKASSYMLAKGFEHVYHLKGGILKYLEEFDDSKVKDSAWNGQCFVFDDRVSVGHGLNPGNYRLCRGCRHPNSVEDTQLGVELFREGVYCRYCVNKLTNEQKEANLERHNQMQLSAKRNEVHLGRPV